jgi:multidrug efflux pump subunit AcrA (membrane-fusion protein)
MTASSGDNMPDRIGGAHAPGATVGQSEQRSRVAFGDPVRALVRLAEGRAPDTALLRDALRLACAEFGAIFGLAKATVNGHAVEDHWHTGPHDPAFWREPASKALSRAIATAQSVDVRYRAREQPVRLAIVAAPIGDGDGDALGALSLVLEVGEDREIERARIELRSFAAALWLIMRARPAPSREGGARDAGSSAGELRAVAAAASAPSRVGVAIAIVNQLRTKLGCEQVAIGSVRRRGVKLLAISGLADVNARTAGCLAIQAAMEEALDLGRPVTVSAASTDGDGCPLHRHWSGACEGASVASIPIEDPATKSLVAIVALRHVPGRRFQPEELKKIGESLAAFPAALRVAELAHRSLLAHAVDAAGRLCLGIGRGWAQRGIRFAVSLALLALMLWVVFGTMTHTVGARASIAPTLVQHLTAPFEGRIAWAEARDGDRVREGEALARLDTSALEVERARLAAAVRAAEIEAEVARSKGDHAHARLVLARCEVDRASLASVERRIEEAVIRAPADGFVLRGEVRDRVGAHVPSGASLVEFVPNGSLRLLLEIHEHDVLHVGAGAPVEFRPNARPDLTLALAVDRVRPAAEMRSAESVFIAEVALDRVEPWMLAGVEGVARVSGDPEPVWWVLCHRMIDTVRLRLWL